MAKQRSQTATALILNNASGAANAATNLPSAQDGINDVAHQLANHSSLRRRGVLLGGSALLAAVVAATTVWASLVPLASAVIAPGVVEFASGRHTVQHFEGGIIDKVLVTEGEQVRAGQVLVQLRGSHSRAALALLRQRYRLLLVQIARLTAERDGLPAIEFPDEITQNVNDPDVAKLVDGQERLFIVRGEALRGQTAIQSQRVSQARRDIEDLRARLKIAGARLAAAEQELLAAAERGRQNASALRRKAEYETRLSKLHAAVIQAEQTITEAKLQVLDLRNQRLDKITGQLAQLQTEAFALLERLRPADDEVKRLAITAPRGGVVTGLRFRTPGGVIPERAVIADIAPKGDALIIETRIRPQDIDAVGTDMPVQVRFTAFGGQNAPLVGGRLVQISADRFVDATSNTGYYLGRVELAAGARSALPSTLRAGMSAEVFINTGERTTFAYLAEPLVGAMRRALREG